MSKRMLKKKAPARRPERKPERNPDRKTMDRRAGPGGKPALGGRGPLAAAGNDHFPPASTSLDTLLVGHSDRRFRDLIYKVLSTSALMLRARDCFAAHMGVSGPQYSMMVAIGEAGTATVGQIARQLHVSSPFVTAEVGKLIARGILERQPNKMDRRSSLLALTERGKGLIREVGPLRRATNDAIFGSLTRSQVRALHEIMDTLLTDSERALHALGSPGSRKATDRARGAGR